MLSAPPGARLARDVPAAEEYPREGHRGDTHQHTPAPPVRRVLRARLPQRPPQHQITVLRRTLQKELRWHLTEFRLKRLQISQLHSAYLARLDLSLKPGPLIGVKKAQRIRAEEYVMRVLPRRHTATSRS
ncbi:hypothetical protein ACIOKD_02485 [Streptomyces sp. NPDC087844]|uniref:hypothetical protein n=1 Tax=Streptomyces sp. NPDC087844 TaxID=3365805 RepID=UPI0038091B51